jgi:hypothetical protein
MTRNIIEDEVSEERTEQIIRLTLFVDDQEESNKAIKLMNETGLEFEIWKKNGEEGDYWTPPVLYAPEGIFNSLANINSFARMRSANGGICMLLSYAK